VSDLRLSGEPAPIVGTSSSTVRGDMETERLTRRGLHLTQFTVVYNVAEGLVSITFGLLAGLISLIGFGLDSGIESGSAVLVGLRLAARLRHGKANAIKERRTLKLVAVTFFVLAAYVVIEGTRSLIIGEMPERSPAGIVLLALSIIVMPILARAKRRVAERLGGDPLILADAAETKICVLLSISTLAGLTLYGLTGAGWLDPMAGFVIALFAVMEGLEAWHGELIEDDSESDRVGELEDSQEQR
jgi:divalent metal cation (Fe/Co/Zn/Cd) transporter